MDEKKESILHRFWHHLRGELFEEDPADIISNNAKSVLIGLFILIGLAIIFYAITVSATYFTEEYKKQTEIINQTISNPASVINVSQVYDLAQRQFNITQQLQNNIKNTIESNNKNSNDILESQNELAKNISKLTQNQAQALTNSQSIDNLEEIGDKFNELQKRDQLLEQINTVFIAAISGAIALGGTLITQLWGRKD